MDQEIDAKLPADASSTSEATVNDTSKTQVDEKSTEQSKSGSDTPFHEHPRFKEVIEEKNKMKMEAEMLRQEVETLKRQSAGSNENAQRQSVVDQYISDLVEQGMDRSAATKFAQQQLGLFSAVAGQYTQPIIQNQQQLNLNMAMKSFKEEHKDYDKYNLKMGEVLNGLDSNDRSWVLSNINKGLEYLYDKAKQNDIENIEKSSFEKGKQEAYEKKQEKASVSQTRSSSPATFKSLSDELSKVKSHDDYAKKKAELDRLEAEALGVTYRGF